LEHAIEVNPGGVNGPIRIAVVEKQRGKLKARVLLDDELYEHKQNVEATYEALRRFRDRQSVTIARDLPEMPKIEL
jgi:hypothetical protein